MAARVAATLMGLGRVTWRQALRAQVMLNEHYSELGTTVLFCEHPPTYTAGRRERFSAEEEMRLRSLGADVIEAKRGGQLTFHGPGQLMGYIITDTRRHGGVRCFVDGMEKSLVAACASFGLKGTVNEHTGVWIGDSKVAAIGLEVKRGISMHGFCLNCNPDLSFFEHIVPCGLPGRSATSLSKELGRDVTIDEAALAVVEGMTKHLHLDLTAEPTALMLERVWQAAPFSRPEIEDRVPALQQLLASANTSTPATGTQGEGS